MRGLCAAWLAAAACAEAPAGGARDAQATVQAAEPVADAPEVITGAEAGAGEVSGRQAGLLAVAVAPKVVPGAPFPVDIVWPGAPASLPFKVLALGETHRGLIYRGRGSVTLQAPSAGSVAITVSAGGLVADLAVVAEARPVRVLSGPLAGADLVWGAAEDVRVEGTATVAAGAFLSIEAGARVLLGGKASLEVQGELSVAGTPEAPVLITRAGSEPWGGVRILGGKAVISYAWLTGGGGDPARVLGHSGSQPVVYVEDGTLEMHLGGVVDNPGKALGSQRSSLALEGVLITRCDTGGELIDSEVSLVGCHVLEIPDGDGVATDDDNDGLYLYGVRVVAGEERVSTVTECVFAFGEDDGIDHNGARVRVERTWIEGFRHEGVAASNGRRIEIVDSVVRGCEQGIEAGYGAPEVRVEHCTVTGNGVGLRFGDDYTWEATGKLVVTHTIATGNLENVVNYDVGVNGPGDLEIACSMVDAAAWDGRNGNRSGAPELDAEGCPAGSLNAACDAEPMGPTGCK